MCHSGKDDVWFELTDEAKEAEGAGAHTRSIEGVDGDPRRRRSRAGMGGCN